MRRMVAGNGDHAVLHFFALSFESGNDQRGAAGCLGAVLCSARPGLVGCAGRNWVVVYAAAFVAGHWFFLAGNSGIEKPTTDRKSVV